MMLGVAVAAAFAADPTVPHLAQAWQAMSTGDGLPGETGLESYIYEDCKEKSDTCMAGHVFNYGADNCIKYEVDRGHSQFSGTFYVKCDAVDCCTAGSAQVPDVKKWDIGQAGAFLQDKVTYLGKKDTTGLNDEPVKGADTYFEEFNIPFAKNIKANYTYYVTTNGTDVITHRIEYGVTGQTAGRILYGDFKVQHNLTAFRKVFEAPAECLKRNTVTCSDAQMKAWDRKYFNKGAPVKP